MRRVTGYRILPAMVLLAGFGSTNTTAQMPSAPAGDHDLRAGMRKLWADHVVWTRVYIISAVGGQPDARAALNRLMKNQEDIGKAIVPYYGAAAGTRLTDLLKQHISIAGEIVTAAKANDNAKLADANRRWHTNADDIATFLSEANPNWTKSALVSMLNEHLALTTKEATARLQQRWDEDVATFDQIFDQAMMMADALSGGILKQHPARR
ncbi:MAG: glycosyltransferase [Gemmatimonadota bacterium]